jgi:uncharacterized protein
MSHAPLTASQIIDQTARHVHGLAASDSSGHDWWHIDRVRRLALHIARCEGASLFTVELAALVHDIADWKFHRGDDTLGPMVAAEWLAGLGVDDAVIKHVSQIVRDVSFKGAGVSTPMPTVEGRAVQDADRLDAMGAIGIARAFAYGGHAGQPMHDPCIEVQMHGSFEAYKRADGTTINHFHEKLLLLKDRMTTPTGRRLAEARHAFMEQFLGRFEAEWRGAS